jgi:hypothetical protein
VVAEFCRRSKSLGDATKARSFDQTDNCPENQSDDTFVNASNINQKTFNDFFNNRAESVRVAG